MVSLRPLMAVFLVGLISVLIVLALSRPAFSKNVNSRRFGNYPILIGSACVGIGFLIVQTIRDYILSGWLQFPMSIHPFQVSWLAPDPEWNRAPTLGAARDPQHLWDAISGFSWVVPWLKALGHQWEFYMLLLALLVTVVAVRLAWKTGLGRFRAMALTMMPSVATVIVWFFATPPSFRFAWGPVFSLAIIPLAWSLKVLADTRLQFRNKGSVDSLIIGITAVSIISILSYCSIERLHPTQNSFAQTWSLGPVHVDYWVDPVPDAATQPQLLNSGLSVLIPTKSDQCWNTYPLCTAQLSPSTRLRGASIQEGFLH